MGIYEYNSNNIEKAYTIFNDICEAGDEDKALNIYMERCQYYLKHGTPMIFENI